MRSLTFGFSPCPNDTFAFHALVHGLVEAPFAVEPVLLDIEELNQRARTGELDLTKLSFGACAGGGDRYRLLRSGAALGHGVGPLVVAREPMRARRGGCGRIADSGPRHHCLPASPSRVRRRSARSSSCATTEILDAVAAGEVDAGPDHPREPVHLRRARARPGRRPRRVVGGGDRPAGPARRDLRARGRRRCRRRSSARSAPRSSTPSRIPRRAASTCASTRRSCRRRSARAHRPVRERVQRRPRRAGARRDRAARVG